MERKRIDELKVGDLVDLEADVFANSNGEHPEYEFELAQVVEIERETPTCICVYFETGAVGFPPEHLVSVQEQSR